MVYSQESRGLGDVYKIEASGGVGVFSEVYFPWGWHATIDGEPAELARVNYILRAIAIPAGSHTIEMTFSPESLGITGRIAYACVTVIYMLVLAAVFFRSRKGLHKIGNGN